MIFSADVARAVLAGEVEATCRPLLHKNGHALAYKLDTRYPVQPGRFQHHIGHVRVTRIEVATTESLRADPSWDVPESYSGLLAVLYLEPAERCPRCAP
jgi:hypothetical protein